MTPAMTLELTLVLVITTLGVSCLNSATRAWRLSYQPIDFAMRILIWLWLLYLLTSVAVEVALVFSWALFLQHIRYAAGLLHQCLLVSVAFFLLSAAASTRTWVFYLLALQAIGGFAALSWLTWSDSPSPVAHGLLLGLNLVTASVVALLIVRQVRHTHSQRSWLALATCLIAFGLWSNHAVAGDNTHFLQPSAYYLLAFVVFLIWKLISSSAHVDQVLFSQGTPATTGISRFAQPLTTSADDDFIALAVRGERERIAHELHDNVGSQITGILFAMQASTQPHKQFVLLSLEQCLTNLKMAVDALDSFDEDVTHALGLLRYRVQHALDRQGICLSWDVQVCAELEAVQGIYAQQVLRIAQESVANVMRHAKASLLRVTCQFLPEFCHLLLEVWDDGVGIAPSSPRNPTGQGLAGMKRRAAAVGGHLVISSSTEGGTCVRLTLPLPHLKPKRGGVEKSDDDCSARSAGSPAPDRRPKHGP